MGMGGAQDRRVQRPGPHRQVVGVLPTADEQRRILNSLDGTA
jgi:hypothetical protein